MSARAAGGKSTTTVTLADQQNINRFARLNSRHVEVVAEVGDTDRELENVREATEAVEELQITGDEGTLVAYRVGDVFFNLQLDDALTRLQGDKDGLSSNREKRLEEKGLLETQMNTLKTELYGKFGDQINLDPEAD